jgi:hypothetical protein
VEGWDEGGSEVEVCHDDWPHIADSARLSSLREACSPFSTSQVKSRGPKVILMFGQIWSKVYVSA